MTRIEVPNSSLRRAPRRGLRILAMLMVILLAGAALWTWLTLSWAYADGDRAGVLQKFVRRGWMCKTYEGEIALYYGGGQYLGPGSSPQMWDFSVRDPAVAAQLSKVVGRRVQLHYTEHPGVPSACFAETRYFVDRVVVTDENGENSSPGAPASRLAPVPGATSSSGAAPSPGTGASQGIESSR